MALSIYLFSFPPLLKNFLISQLCNTISGTTQTRIPRQVGQLPEDEDEPNYRFTGTSSTLLEEKIPNISHVIWDHAFHSKLVKSE